MEQIAGNTSKSEAGGETRPWLPAPHKGCSPSQFQGNPGHSQAAGLSPPGMVRSVENEGPWHVCAHTHAHI